MRRKEKEITETSDIEAVIKQSTVCRLGLSDDNFPYIVPLCFGYQGNTVYVHAALEGKKIDILRKNQNVCFEFDISAEIIKAEKACGWGMKFKSVIGFGRASFLEDPGDKQKALSIIMDQYANKTFQFSEKALDRTAVVKIEIESMTGKQSGF